MGSILIGKRVAYEDEILDYNGCGLHISVSDRQFDGPSTAVNKHGKFLIFNPMVDMENPTVILGLYFQDTPIFRDDVRQHSIPNARDIVFPKNDKDMVQVKCEHETCPWLVYASKLHGKDTMQVKTVHSIHECCRVERVSAANSKWLELVQGGNNFKATHKGLALKVIVWNAAKATRIVNFEKALKDLRERDLEAYKWITKRFVAHCSRSYFITYPKCDILLNNMCESFKALILNSRSKPIIDMLETIRIISMKMLLVKRDQMKKCKCELCPNVQKMFEEYKKKRMEFISHWNGHDKFELEGFYGKRADFSRRVGCADEGKVTVRCRTRHLVMFKAPPCTPMFRIRNTGGIAKNI
ncbi:hypothetical protein BUALT_Bualt19G0036800 [Buddleja alternifolia]|uniref:Transposase MuDR plant domain-containing protein n=1 Tax=Buddleja alternifolia TaxID=168488 RepID=A0AAV6W1M5_9LAMI|nr:hypothetical protein BUALT_Bualt19G0036800 [Buddleja alternifolia]